MIFFIFSTLAVLVNSNYEEARFHPEAQFHSEAEFHHPIREYQRPIRQYHHPIRDVHRPIHHAPQSANLGALLAAILAARKPAVVPVPPCAAGLVRIRDKNTLLCRIKGKFAASCNAANEPALSNDGKSFRNSKPVKSFDPPCKSDYYAGFSQTCREYSAGMLAKMVQYEADKPCALKKDGKNNDVDKPCMSKDDANPIVKTDAISEDPRLKRFNCLANKRGREIFECKVEPNAFRCAEKYLD